VPPLGFSFDIRCAFGLNRRVLPNGDFAPVPSGPGLFIAAGIGALASFPIDSPRAVSLNFKAWRERVNNFSLRGPGQAATPGRGFSLRRAGAAAPRGAPKQTRAKLRWSIARVHLLAFAIALHLRCLSALLRFEGAASDRESRERRREPVFVFCGSAIARR
jgi:hypothetical protein